jgi:hypothetical protein
MPIGPFADWAACMRAMRKKYSKKVSEKVCGKMEADANNKEEYKPCPKVYKQKFLEMGFKEEKASEMAWKLYYYFYEMVELSCRGPGDAKRPDSDFAIPRLRALPYKKGGTVDCNCVRNALARLNQVHGASTQEKSNAKSKLQSALKGCGGKPSG